MLNLAPFPDVMKKFRRILLRTAIDADHPYGFEVCLTNSTDYEYLFSNLSIDGAIYNLEFEVEERYEHRARFRRQDIDLGFYDGYGGTYELYAGGV